jgi:CO/xanthine dehydrogenase Mo-binding subunit
VAAVAATTPTLAEQALGRIRVEYAPLPIVLDVVESMQPDAPLLHDDLRTSGVEPPPERASNVALRFAIDLGDLEQGFAEADVVF